MDCGAKCMKYMLFAFNFLFWVLGIAVLGVGIYSRIKSDNYDTILGDGGASSAANILIASGVFVSIIGFVGCCGAIKENKTMLIIYFILVLLIFILEIAAGALAYAKKDEMEEELTKNIQKIIMDNYSDDHEADAATKGFVKAIDWFQIEVKCCGAEGYTDWKKSNWGKENVLKLAPKSCCIEEDCVAIKSTIYNTGCIAAGKTYVKEHLWQVGGVGVGIAVIQLLVMIAAICLCRTIGKEGLNVA